MINFNSKVGFTDNHYLYGSTGTVIGKYDNKFIILIDNFEEGMAPYPSLVLSSDYLEEIINKEPNTLFEIEIKFNSIIAINEDDNLKEALDIIFKDIDDEYYPTEISFTKMENIGDLPVPWEEHSIPLSVSNCQKSIKEYFEKS